MKTTKLTKLEKGFSTFELLIAFTVMTLTLVAVIMVAFGNQALVIDTELAQRGIYVAKELLEETGLALKTDFHSVATQTTATAYNSIYDTQVKINDLSPCVREVASNVYWQRNLNEKKSFLQTIAVSPSISQALGNDCETQQSKKDWHNPVSLSFSAPLDFGTGGTGIDVVGDINNPITILTTKWTSGKNTLSVLRTINLDTGDPEVIGGVEASDQRNFTALDAYLVPETNIIYAFIASASTTASLQIYKIDVNDPWSAIVTRVAKAALPQTNTAVARTIFYYDNKVYLGTQYLACPASCAPSQNSEFHIFDVSTATNPSWQGSVNINHNVNDIEVLGDWAYLAVSDNDRELVTIGINPANVDYLTHHDITSFGYNASGNDDGQTLAVSGQYVYLGRRRSKDYDDFFALKVTDLTNSSSVTDGLQSSSDLDHTTCTYQAATITTKACLGTNSSISDITLQGSLAFLVTTQPEVEFQVWDITEPTAIKPKAKCNSTKFIAKPVAVDFFGDYGYLALESNEAFQIIYDNTKQICLP